MGTLVHWIDRKFYPGIAENLDDQVFRERIFARLRPESVVLDLGAGSGLVQQMNFRGKAGRIYGVDLDPRVVENPMLDEGIVTDVGILPFEDGKFDVVFSNKVLKHLEAHLKTFAQMSRVPKKSSESLACLPNRHLTTNSHPFTSNDAERILHTWQNTLLSQTNGVQHAFCLR